MCTHTLTTFSACGCKHKILTTQCFNGKMGRNGGSCSYLSTRFATQQGKCMDCLRKEKEERKLAEALGQMTIGGEGV